MHSLCLEETYSVSCGCWVCFLYFERLLGNRMIFVQQFGVAVFAKRNKIISRVEVGY